MINVQPKTISVLIKITVVSLGFLFLLRDAVPLMQQIAMYQEKIRSAKAAAKTLSQEDKAALQSKMQQGLDKLAQEYRKLQAIQQHVQSKLTKESNVPMVTLMVEDLAAANHIELRLIKPLAMENAGVYKTLPIVLEFSCEYIQLANFIDQLKSLSLPVSVRNLTIHENQQLAPKQEVKLTIFVLFSTA